MQLAVLRHEIELRDRSEAELVELARQGGEDAIRVLVRRNNQRLFRVARGILRDDAEAEDVVQETYVRAFTRLESFRGDSLFSTWLTRIALNEALGRVRRRRMADDISDGDHVIMFPTSLPTADGELVRKEVREALEKIIDELPQAFRLVFILRDVEEMSTEETATQLSLKPETVKTRLHRARRLMRQSIEKRFASAFSDLFPFAGARCERMADRVVARLQALS